MKYQFEICNGFDRGEKLVKDIRGCNLFRLVVDLVRKQIYLGDNDSMKYVSNQFCRYYVVPAGRIVYRYQFIDLAKHVRLALEEYDENNCNEDQLTIIDDLVEYEIDAWFERWFR